MPTIGDVAAMANVSTATVSRALNGKSSVHPELARRVRAAAQELGYQPHGPARNLRRQSTAVLSLVLPDITTPFFTAIARGFEDTARDNGYSVLLGNTDDNAAKERHYLDVAVRERVDGVALVPADPHCDTSSLICQNIPVVATGRRVPTIACDQVFVDVTAAAARATACLIEAGYQRIGCVTAAAGPCPAEDALTGYHNALERAGIPSRPDLVVHATSSLDDEVSSLLDQPDPPDAVVVCDHLPAVLLAAGRRGLRIGSDLGLVSFDDAPWTAATDPSLSTVTMPASAVGRTAAELVLARIDDCDRPVEQVVLNAGLTVRDSSTRPAHASARSC